MGRQFFIGSYHLLVLPRNDKLVLMGILATHSNLSVVIGARISANPSELGDELNVSPNFARALPNFARLPAIPVSDVLSYKI